MSLSKYVVYSFFLGLVASLPLVAAEDVTETISSSLSAILEDDTLSKGASASDDNSDVLNNTEKMSPENVRAEGENETKSPSTILKNNPPFERPPFENSLPPFERTNPFEEHHLTKIKIQTYG